jgi:hypothetical protein
MENFSLYQLLVPIFAAVMILRSLSQLGRKEKTIREFIAVLFFWAFISLIALFPEVFLDRVAAYLGIRSGINALFFFAIIVLFYITSRLLVNSEETEERITKIIRNVALKDFESKHKNDKK